MRSEEANFTCTLVMNLETDFLVRYIVDAPVGTVSRATNDPLGWLSWLRAKYTAKAPVQHSSER